MRLTGLVSALRAAACILLGATPALQAQDKERDPHDYPTVERVMYVEACMAEHPGGHYEMLNKCSCALDTIMRRVTFDDYDTMSTAFKAGTIAGERGGE